MPVGSNFDTSWFAAAIELDGTVQENFPFGNGRELFNLCKAKDPVIENIWRTKIFDSTIFIIHKVFATKIHKNIVSQIFGAIRYYPSGS